MKKEIAKGDTSKQAVKDPSPLHSSPEENQSFGPEGIGILYGKSGQGKANEGDQHHQVDEPVKDIEPPVDFSNGTLGFFHCRASIPSEPLMSLPEYPDQGMRIEEGQYDKDKYSKTYFNPFNDL